MYDLQIEKTRRLSQVRYIPFEQVQSMTGGLGSPSYCTSCGDLDEYGGCEPDARGYFCGRCETHNKMGLDYAILSGRLVIDSSADWLDM